LNALGTKTRDVVRDATLDLVKSFQVWPKHFEQAYLGKPGF
jgi:hypothetical protein